MMYIVQTISTALLVFNEIGIDLSSRPFISTRDCMEAMLNLLDLVDILDLYVSKVLGLNFS